MSLSMKQIQSLIVAGTASFFVGTLLRIYWQEITLWFRIIAGIFQ